MKRIVGCIICVLAIISLVACGNNTEEPKEIQTEAPLIQEIAETAPVKVECRYQWDAEPETLDIDIVEYFEGVQLQDNRQVLSLAYQKFELAGDFGKKYESLQTGLNELASEMESEMDREVLMRDIQECLEEREDYPGISSENKCSVTRADSNIVSIRNEYFWDGGGAHPDAAELGYVFDSKSGKRLGLDDVVTDRSAFFDEAKKQLLETYTPDSFFDLDNDIEAYKNGEKTIQFELSYDGLTGWFNHYEIAPYAAGIMTVSFDYDTYGDLFFEGLGERPDDYVMRIYPGESAKVNEKIVSVGEIYDENYIFKNITVNGTQFKTYTYTIEPYLIRKDGKTFIYSFESGDDDETWYQIISLNEESPCLVEKRDGEIYKTYESFKPDGYPDTFNAWGAVHKYRAFTTPDYIELTSGKGTDGQLYSVGNDGKPEVR